ncbi:GntR family transcriptional regulator [Arthrobacter sp. NPDC056493]|uniref:GntR family transcriptional regulator n=1 Tax=Arthrobacter sp. NPDC056493 TaxID=3345839 RepID=UPI00366A8A0B
MDIQILKHSPVPLYFQIAEAIQAEVRRNNLAKGHKLMSESELAQQLKVSRGTIRHAMQILADRHIITRTQGSGTNVA